MKLKVSRKEFYRAVQKVINVIPSKTTVEIAYNVLLHAEDSTLKIIATDMDITQITWISCEIDEPGAITVPGKLLMDILREMPDIDLEIQSDDDYKILINSDFGHYKISGQDKAEFPSVPVVSSEARLELKNNTLKRMIEKTLFACSTDNLRPALTGVFCQILEDEYRMVSTDGHRLVKFINRDYDYPGFTKEIIVPTKALNFVARNLPEEGSHEITISENHILFELPNTKIYSRLITDPYPDYERVIPDTITKEMTINKEQFISSVKRVSLFSNPMTYQVRLNLQKDNLTVYAQDIDFGGEASENIGCNFSDESMEIAYNANYLMDVLRHIDSNEIRFFVEDPDGPGLAFPSEQQEEEELLMLIMPVRLNS